VVVGFSVNLGVMETPGKIVGRERGIGATAWFTEFEEKKGTSTDRGTLGLASHQSPK